MPSEAQQYPNPASQVQMADPRRRGCWIAIACCALPAGLLLVAVLYQSGRIDDRIRLKESHGVERYHILYERLGSELKPGMAKEEVAAICGLPDNADRRYVWFWLCADRDEDLKGMSTWAEMLTSSDTAPRLFLFFDQRGLLISPMMLRSVDGDPWELFKHYAGFRDREQVEQLLGPSPFWAKRQ